MTVVREWVHNDNQAQWELRVRYRDEMREQDVDQLIAVVTDEFITRISLPYRAAEQLHAKLGSVPPPWQHFIPSDADRNRVIYAQAPYPAGDDD